MSQTNGRDWTRERWRKQYVREPLQHRAWPVMARGLRELLNALAEAMPHASRDDIEAAFRYGRTIFAEVLLYRCGKMGGSCRPRGFREDDVERALRFVEAGVAGMAPTRN